MKRYILFTVIDYESAGGWHDYAGTFDTPESAWDKALEMKRGGGWLDQAHVVDVTTGEIVLDRRLEELARCPNCDKWGGIEWKYRNEAVFHCRHCNLTKTLTRDEAVEARPWR